MKKIGRITFAATVALLLSLTQASAQQKFVSSVGAVFSPKACGLTCNLGDGNLLRVVGDLEDVLTGNSKYPGIAGQYFMVFYKQLSKDDAIRRVRFYGGPGLCAGWVADNNITDFGAMFALGAVAGISIDGGGRYSVDVGLSANVGIHVVPGNEYDTKIRLYRNGYRKAWMPEITIKRAF